jgi:hypothetical protein
MKRFKVFAGIGGGFGGGTFRGVEEHTDQSNACVSAYNLAIEEYDDMAGLHGLRSIEDIMEEEDIDDREDAQEMYNEERESWMDYYVEEVRDGVEVDEDGEDIIK